MNSTQSSPDETDVFTLIPGTGAPPKTGVTANFASAPAASPAPCVRTIGVFFGRLRDAHASSTVAVPDAGETSALAN